MWSADMTICFTMKQTINATEFKAKCLELLDQVGRGELQELAVTKRGQVVARLVPPTRPPASMAEWRETMHGSVHIPAAFDLTAPASDDVWDAELGILHR